MLFRSDSKWPVTFRRPEGLHGSGQIGGIRKGAALRNGPTMTRNDQDPAEDPTLPLEEELDEAPELLPQQEPPDPADPLPPADLDPLLTDPAD